MVFRIVLALDPVISQLTAQPVVALIICRVVKAPATTFVAGWLSVFTNEEVDNSFPVPCCPQLASRRRKPSSVREGNGLHIRLEPAQYRSEEHTSELQSRSDLVCRLLLEKKKKKKKTKTVH